MTETFLKFLQKNLKINITYLFRPLNSNNIIYQIRIKTKIIIEHLPPLIQTLIY